ncbi:MAG: hypothetical protein CMH55_08420 [Myxococcales bacterium]|nr:hypothetical protein [Myxococcales bacterium]
MTAAATAALGAALGVTLDHRSGVVHASSATAIAAALGIDLTEDFDHGCFKDERARALFTVIRVNEQNTALFDTDTAAIDMAATQAVGLAISDHQLEVVVRDGQCGPGDQ